MDVRGTEAWKARLQNASSWGLFRNSLDRARDLTKSEPKRLVRSLKTEDSAQAFDIPQAISLDVPPPKAAMLRSWVHGDASSWLRASQPDEETFDYAEAQLLAAATFCAAEFEVSWSFPKETAYEFVF